MFVDIFYVYLNQILQNVDESSLHRAAHCLLNVTAEAMTHAMRLCWIDVYLARPGVVTDDAGQQIVANVLQTNARLQHIDT